MTTTCLIGVFVEKEAAGSGSCANAGVAGNSVIIVAVMTAIALVTQGCIGHISLEFH